MAYAFDKVSDYFRRQKTGQRGGLDKGTTGAPPPTAAAENLAKQGETSAEIGASDTGAYRANMAASQAGTQKALVNPAQRQASAWTANEQQKAGEYQKSGEEQIAKTYKPVDTGNVAKVEAGDQGAMNTVREQIGYTGNELAFQPYQASNPDIDTTSMLSGGVGGIQAALQKGRGGRYTSGMGALDASLLAANRGAMQETQGQLGGIYEGARQEKARLEQTDENLAKSAKKTASETAKAVRKALEDRQSALDKAYGEKVTSGASAAQTAARGSINERDAMVNALMAQGLTGMQALDILGTGQNSADIANRMALYNPKAINDIIAQKRNLGQYVTTGPQATYTEGPDAAMQNVYSVLGLSPQARSAQYSTYGINQPGMNDAAANLARQYRYLTSIQGVAPQQMSSSPSQQEGGDGGYQGSGGAMTSGSQETSIGVQDGDIGGWGYGDGGDEGWGGDNGGTY